MSHILENYQFAVGNNKKPQRNENLLPIAGGKKSPKILTCPIFGAHSLQREYIK